jgi:hypothetical protein
MIVQTREFGYGADYNSLFEGMKKWKALVEKKFPDIQIELMYNLAGERGRLTVLTRFASLGDYERIDAEMDADEELSAALAPHYESIVLPMKDQFYRVIS